jgi:DNA-binding protein YbaB
MVDRTSEFAQELMAQITAQTEAINKAGKEAVQEKIEVITKKRTLKVTVDGRGDLVDIHFLGKAYRTLPATELATQLVDAIRTAREQAAATGMAKLSAAMPHDFRMPDLGGTLDVDAFLADAMSWLGDENESGGNQGGGTERRG